MHPTEPVLAALFHAVDFLRAEIDRAAGRGVDRDRLRAVALAAQELGLDRVAAQAGGLADDDEPVGLTG